MITINDPPLNERLRNYFDNSESSRWGHSADDMGRGAEEEGKEEEKWEAKKWVEIRGGEWGS